MGDVREGLTARVGAAVATMGDAPSRSRRSSAASVSHASLMVEGGGCRCSQERARRCRVDAAGVAGCAPRMVAVLARGRRRGQRRAGRRRRAACPRGRVRVRVRGARGSLWRREVGGGNKRDEGVSCRREHQKQINFSARRAPTRGARIFRRWRKSKTAARWTARDRRRSRIPTSASGQGPQPASSE